MVDKPKLGFFSFTCCEGCQFAALFVDDVLGILESFDIQYFHLLKQKNRESDIDLAFVEGAITSEREVKKLEEIREKSNFVVAFGACATHGGIPSQRNLLEDKELENYVYNQEMLEDSIEATPVSEFIDIDYFMYGCPIIEDEFVDFVRSYLEIATDKEGGRKDLTEKTRRELRDLQPEEGPVCSECPRQGTEDCFLRQQKECLGSITHKGCDALCPSNNIPCTMCRGPLESSNVAKEINIFESFGIPKKEVLNKLRYFTNVEDES